MNQEEIKAKLNYYIELGDKEEIEEYFCMYKKFCYDNDLQWYDHDLWHKLANMYIIDTKPQNFEIDESRKNLILNKITSNIAIEEDEVEVLLESVVNYARNRLDQEINEDIMESNLGGTCGFASAACYFLLEELGLKVTSNQAADFPFSGSRHNFITVTIPVHKNGLIVNKQYLIDITYRQFFTMVGATAASLYSKNSGPDAGYFMHEKDHHDAIVHEILSKGFIELTPEVAKAYGYGFSCSSINVENMEELYPKICNVSAMEYHRAINEKQFAIDYDYDEIFQKEEKPLLYNPIPNISNIERNVTV